MSKNAVVIEDPTKKALALPDEMADFLSENDGSGFENIKPTDLAVPYFGILQALSPAVKKGPERIPGAEEGDVLNSLTKELIKGEEGFRVIPAAYVKKIVEWVPRSAGGGFVAQHDFDQAWLDKHQKDERGRPISVNGNDLIETAIFFVLRLKDDGTTEHGIISMTSTQLKKARAWNAIRMNFHHTLPNGKTIVPPAWAQIYHLTTVQESKADQTWFGWRTPANPEVVTDKALALAAKKFAEDVMGGKVEVKPVQEEEPATTDAF
jgi:hypothetical protein